MSVGLTARREVLSLRLRLMVGGGSLGLRRGRLRANVSGNARNARRVEGCGYFVVDDMFGRRPPFWDLQLHLPSFRVLDAR